MKHARVIAAILALAASSGAGVGQDCTAPCLHYAASNEWGAGWLSPGSSFDVEPSAETTLGFIPVEHVLLAATLTTEPVVDDRLGTYVEELHAGFERGPISLTIGKFEPVQGWASPSLQGIHATDIAGNLDTAERWGVSAGYGFAALGLEQLVTASLFTIDRTILSESLFTNRGRTLLSDGGAGNSEGVSSATLYLSACRGAAPMDCYGEGDWGYRLGARYQEAGRATPDQIKDGIEPGDEWGMLASAVGNLDLGDEATLKLLGEAAWLRNFEDGDGGAFLATLSAALAKGQWTLEATYSRQEESGEATQHLADFTAIYDFASDATLLGEEWQLAAGYSYASGGGGDRSHTISFRVTVGYENNLELGN